MNVKQGNLLQFQQVEQIRTKRPNQRHISPESSTGCWLQACAIDDRNQEPSASLSGQKYLQPMNKLKVPIETT